MGVAAPEGSQQEVRRRLYYPVFGCPAGNCAWGQEWNQPACLRMHVELHASGRLMGDAPREWMLQ